MAATSQIEFNNECRSFSLESEKRDVHKRIPRPPNAFMLYRSDFLKRRAVPPEVEKRQQNLSRIAGQCWNMLPDNEKAVWYSKAAVVRAEHRARYPSRKIGPFQGDTNKISIKEKRSATSSGRSSGPVRRLRSRQSRVPYCEGMFAALHDSRHSSPASQPCLLSASPALESSLSTNTSLSPLSLPQLLPLFPSHAHPNQKDSPSASVESSMIHNKIGFPLDSLNTQTPQWGLNDRFQELEITSSGVGSPEPSRAFQQDKFATCVPLPSPKYFPELQSDPVFQVSPVPPGSDAFSPAGYSLANPCSLVNHFVADGLAHFNPFLVPFYPLHNVESNIPISNPP